MSAFSFVELKSLKTIVDFCESADWTSCGLSMKNNIPTLDIKVSYKIAKSFYKDLKVDDEDDDYLLTLLMNGDKLVVQFPKSLIKQESQRQQPVQDAKFKIIYDTLKKIYVDKMFQSIESLKLAKMRSLVADFDEEATQPQEVEEVEEPQEVEEKYESKAEEKGSEAKDEMLNMLESALGSITSLLSSKIKDKMSFTALKSVIGSVVKTTLATAKISDPAVEKKVLAAISEQGLLPQKTEKKGGSISGYTVFAREMRKSEDFKQQHKDKTSQDITKEIAVQWKALNDEQKKVYNDMAAKEKAENPNGIKSNKGSRKAKSSKSSKSEKPKHTCVFVMTKGENKGNLCGSTVSAEEPTFEGQWLCSKHASAQKKKAESKKSEKKKSKKSEDDEEESEKPKKKKTTKKTEDDEEEKSEKPKKKKTTKKTEEKSDKPKKQEEKKAELIEELEDEVSDEEIQELLNEIFIAVETDKVNKGKIKGMISSENLLKYFKKSVKDSDADTFQFKLNTFEKAFEIRVRENEDEEFKNIGMVMVKNLPAKSQQLQAWIESKDE